MLRVAIYSPYLDTFGGGEKYMMTLGEVLDKNGNDVSVLLDNHLYKLGSNNLRNELSERFNLELSKLDFIKAPLGKGSNLFSRLLFLKKFDVLFYLTDGSIFLSTANRNILHIQSPLVGQPARNLWGKLKLKSWDLIIYNSNFTKKHSEENWPISSKIIYPPVDIDKIKPLKKKKYILTVGRFFGYLRDKKHEILIKVFKELIQNTFIKDWSLHLAGSAAKGDQSYLGELKELAKGLPVNFYPNLSYDELIHLYGYSSIYWHASGFDEDDPTKMEHFGISTVEAMAGGSVPVVIRKGGQIEIVEHGKSGFLWNNLDELKELTMKLIENNDIWKDLSNKAIMRAKNFSKQKFAQKIYQLI